MVEDDRASMKTFSSSSHVLRDLRVSCLSPPPSPSFSFPCMQGSPSATDNPQLWLLVFGDKNTVMGTAQGSNSNQCFRREPQSCTFRKERERIQKLKKNYTNYLEESEIDIKPRPSLDLRQRKREGLISLGLKEKLSGKLSGAPHSQRVAPSTAQAGGHKQIPL